MNKTYPRTEFLANVAIVFVSVLFVLLIIQKFFFPGFTESPHLQIQNGTNVEIKNIDWDKNYKTLVLYVSNGCKFCTDSMPFYRTLANESTKNNTAVVIVSPDSEMATKKYLNENRVKSVEVRQASLSYIGVPGTPTILLVDKSGKIERSWIGKLKPETEKEVIEQMRL